MLIDNNKCERLVQYIIFVQIIIQKFYLKLQCDMENNNTRLIRLCYKTDSTVKRGWEYVPYFCLWFIIIYYLYSAQRIWR